LIRIIPKKGDCTKIEDWRPITLLSCSYKIISGAVAMRIESVILRIIGRGQKGFIKGKNIHMCNMNVMDNISMAWGRGEEVGVLCVDFNKAFDSVEHNVILKVFEFFNFGQIMIKIISTLLRNRNGRVILTEGFSRDFKIERGTPQGDRSSPYIFILCIEVLLLKLEQLSQRDDIRLGFNEILMRREGLQSSLIEACADDLTVIFKWSAMNLIMIKNAIQVFGELTGLTINIKKTQLMIVGVDRMDNDELRTGNTVEGILIVDKIEVLGIKMDRKLIQLRENWIKTIAKIENIVRY
jgi:Reverse transcriptase (RNA-dependent DNA polymerase)